MTDRPEHDDAGDDRRMTRRRLLGAGAVVACGVGAAALAHRRPEGPVVHVDPASGDDEQDGASEASAVATLGRALRLAEERAAGAQNVTVLLADGPHRLASPVTMGPRQGAGRIVVRPRKGATPLIRGDRVIEGWVEGRLPSGQRSWRAKVPRLDGSAWNFRTLFVAGRARPRPRLPEPIDNVLAGRMPLTQRQDFLYSFAPDLDSDAGTMSFSHRGAVSPEWRYLQDVEVVSLREWYDERSLIAAATSTTCTVAARPLGDVTWAPREFYLENVREALRKPGQWYLDRESSVVTYLPMEDEELGGVEISAPLGSTLLRVVGSKQAPAGGVRREGLSFGNTAWDYLQPGVEDGSQWTAAQSAATLRACLQLQYAQDVEVVGCTFADLGEFGVEVGRGCRNVTVQGCEVTRAGGGGIRVASEAGAPSNGKLNTSAVRVTDCRVHECGQVFHMAAGILVQDVAEVEIDHNEVHHLFYTGISTGWRWDYQSIGVSGIRVRHNHVHDLGQGLLWDLGGIYTLGRQTNSVVEHNHVHDVQGGRSPSAGIYLDQGTALLQVRDNLVHDNQEGIWAPNSVSGVVVENNLVHGNSQVQLRDGGGVRSLGLGGLSEWSVRFERNVVVGQGGNLVAAPEATTRSDANLWWDIAGDPTAPPRGTATVVLRSVRDARVVAQAEVRAVNATTEEFTDLSQAVTLDPGQEYDLLVRVRQGQWRWRDPSPVRVTGASMVGDVYSVPDGRFLVGNAERSFGPVNARIRSDRGAIKLVRAGSQQPGRWRNDYTGEVGMRFRAGPGATTLTALGAGPFPRPSPWLQWRARGLDQHSVVADPLLKDPAIGDYSIPSHSPALQGNLGFKAFDLGGFGPR
ncbi:hypothetical protein GCM10027030_18360 [Luteococcus sediminum]